MRRFVLGLLTAVGFVTVVAALGLGALAWRLAAVGPTLPDTIVLTADFSRGLAKGAGPEPLSQLVFGGEQTLRDFLDALERAGDDARVKGLYAQLGEDKLGLATCQEARDA